MIKTIRTLPLFFLALILASASFAQESKLEKKHIFDRSDTELVSTVYDAMTPRRIGDADVSILYHRPFNDNAKHCAKNMEEVETLAKYSRHPGVQIGQAEQTHYYEIVYQEQLTNVPPVSYFNFYRVSRSTSSRYWSTTAQ